MAEKDITEKLLEEQNDVFADIINTLAFDGKEVIRETDLESIGALSSYKMSDKLHSQERDVLKTWRQGCIRIAMCGLENQSTVDYDIPLRVISYDGAAYRAQLDDGTQVGTKRYPVITLVLYFGKGRWSGPKNLLGRLSVPKELEGLVSDYRINVFEIGQLSEEKIKKFSSDFQIVADYVIQMQQGGTYKPSEKPMRHLEGVMDLMEALTKDKKYKEAIQVLRKIKDEGGEATMRSAMDEAVRSAMDEAVRSTETRMRSAMDEAVKQAEERGTQKGLDEGRMVACEDMAKAMIMMGVYSKDEIVKITQLSKSKVEELERAII